MRPQFVDTFDRDLRLLREGGHAFNALEFYRGFLGSATLLDYLPGNGLLVMEEPEWIEAVEDVLRRYLQITSGLMAARGGELYVGRELGAMASALGGRVLHDDIALVSPTTRDVATMFGLNLRAYRDDPWVLAHYDAATLDRIAAGLAAWRTLIDRGRIRWGLRQTIVERSSGLP